MAITRLRYQEKLLKNLSYRAFALDYSVQGIWVEINSGSIKPIDNSEKSLGFLPVGGFAEFWDEFTAEFNSGR